MNELVKALLTAIATVAPGLLETWFDTDTEEEAIEKALAAVPEKLTPQWEADREARKARLRAAAGETDGDAS